MTTPAGVSASDKNPDDSSDEPVIRSSARGGLRDSVLGTRNLMTVAALGVVGAIIVVPLTYLSVVVAVSPRGILVMCALMGVWIIPYLLPGVIVNKPGAFVISGLVMGVVSAFLTPEGPAAILGNLIGSLYVGVPVAIFLYRRWTWRIYAISGIVFGGFNAAVYGAGFHIALTGGQVALGVVLSILSCWAGAGVCLLLKRALARTGVGVTR
ncbi:ECF transporter S component [uncultured Propionibacterium sp.]|uniref:ECF transporter S component n=1 Tax=uncultured Propionibacterium sp. TaxID=218066 RepID=UPI00292D56EF|nr:ECF transporter S component [uncultured Propionibacterium sp.]